MKLKILLILLFTFILLFLHLSKTFAARQRIRKAKGPGGVSVSQGVHASVRFRPDRKGLLISFSHFDNLESGRYELIYESSGITQGAGGSIILGDVNSKELLFATCSANVCNFHENITNARLSIVSVLKTGSTILKPYRIKV